MKLFIGKIKEQQIEDFCIKAIEYHKEIFYKTIEEYEPLTLYNNWRVFIRSIDEIINIPMELGNQKQIDVFLNLNFDFFDPKNFEHLKRVFDILTKKFDIEVAKRFQNLSLMSCAIYKSYQFNGLYNLLDCGLNLSDARKSIIFYQSRRAYYVTILALIPKISRGMKKIDFIDLLNNLQYTIDSCLMGITTSYYNLLLNESLADYEMESDGNQAKGNFDYTHLEGFFLEPERLSLIDQLELRPDVVVSKKMLPKSSNKIFSLSEVTNVISLFEGAFDKYKIQNIQAYKDLILFLNEISGFLINDFDIIINENEFLKISQKYPILKLYCEESDYFAALNSFSPFQKSGGNFYSSVVLLTRFVYRTLSLSLLKNKTFQIHSGFVFEDKVSKMLDKYGLKATGITRINHKEFDLITIKNNKVYNFQCKNNVIDISRVNNDYKIIGRLNRQLCVYYEKALLKEQKRENLIKSKTDISDIEHFLIARYPVITRNEKIINYKDLEQWLRKNHS